MHPAVALPPHLVASTHPDVIQLLNGLAEQSRGTGLARASPPPSHLQQASTAGKTSYPRAEDVQVSVVLNMCSSVITKCCGYRLIQLRFVGLACKHFCRLRFLARLIHLLWLALMCILFCRPSFMARLCVCMGVAE